MSQPQPPPDAAVIAAYQARTEALRSQLATLITRLWRSLGEYRGPQQAQFTRQVVPLVAAAQKQMAALTVGYHTAQRNALLGRSIALHVDPDSVSGAAARGGVDPVEVYGRPFHLVWRQLSELEHEAGAIDRAITAGLDRAVQTAMTDLQLTKVQTSQRVGEQDKQVRWLQRVLEGTHSCGLCIIASTQTYHNTSTLHPRLLPIHPGCDCSVRYSYGDHYPDHVQDPKTLSDLHDRIELRFAASSSSAREIPGTEGESADGSLLQYRDVLVTHEHGEIGTVLAVRGAPFLGPNDI